MQEIKRLKIVNIILSLLVSTLIIFTITLSKRVTEMKSSLDEDIESNNSSTTTSLVDKDIPDALTISEEGVVDWLSLTNYPDSCQPGEVVQITDNALTCTSIWQSIAESSLASPSQGDIVHLSSAAQIYSWIVGRGYISNDSSVPKNDLNSAGILSFDWADDEVSDKLTIRDTGSVDWTALNSYPNGCNDGQAIKTIGDTLVCVDIGGGSALWT